REFLTELIRPLRYNVYQWRHCKTPTGPHYRLGSAEVAYPEFDAVLRTVFTDQTTIPSTLAGQDLIIADAQKQQRGDYRLGGGYYHDLSGFSVQDVNCLSELDKEHHHAYHRLYWAVRYAQAAALGYPDAERSLIADLTPWLLRDWSGDTVVAYPYTTSERIASLAEVLFWARCGELAGVKALLSAIKKQMYRDAHHLSGHIEYKLGVHNHIVNNARALYIASKVLAEAPAASDWQVQAFAVWDKFFPVLLYQDGSLIEGSSFYHVLVARTALEYILAARRENHTLPDGFLAQAEGMFDLSNRLVRADGSLPRFGNSSPDHAIHDLAGLMVAAHLHGILQSEPRAKHVTPLTFYYGAAAASAPQPDTQPESASVQPHFFADGGWAIMSQPALGVELVVHGDTQPKTAAHGDGGRGSFELAWHNTVLIREPGNVSYYDPRRHWYRRGAAQNVSCVQGLAPGISVEYQGFLPDWYSNVQQGQWAQNDQALTYTAHGLARVHGVERVARSWQWSQDAELTLTETLTGSGQCYFASYFHVGDTPWKQVDDAHFRCVLPGARSVLMKINSPPNTHINVIPSFYAPEYGIEYDSMAIKVEGRVNLPIEWSVMWLFQVGTVTV
ncbi:MAG: heparinase II/III family protein, partial [Anaerolineae bacterium]|nr:heparinase II/III family protein [Anaerolineae bacterium]